MRRALCVAALAAMSHGAHAQTDFYAGKQLKMIVGTGPGGEIGRAHV